MFKFVNEKKEAENLYGETTSEKDGNYLQRTSMRFQNFLDKITLNVYSRWIFTLVMFVLFSLRIYFGQGWYINAYALGIYVLNLLISFLSPQVDPEEDLLKDGMELDVEAPVVRRGRTQKSTEYKPFIRRLSEFKFWYYFTKGTLMGLFFTVSRIFDVPVYWPILLGYFICLFLATMKARIQHMIKYKYVPIVSFGKKKYTKK